MVSKEVSRITMRQTLCKWNSGNKLTHFFPETCRANWLVFIWLEGFLMFSGVSRGNSGKKWIKKIKVTNSHCIHICILGDVFSFSITYFITTVYAYSVYWEFIPFLQKLIDNLGYYSSDWLILTLNSYSASRIIFSTLVVVNLRSEFLFWKYFGTLPWLVISYSDNNLHALILLLYFLIYIVRCWLYSHSI